MTYSGKMFLCIADRGSWTNQDPVDIPGKIWYHTDTYHTTMLVGFIENGRTYMEEKEGALGFATRAVHVGNDVDKDSGAIKRPITMANSYALPYDPTDMNWSSAGGNLYTRNGGTNQKYLQERVASLEGGEDCVVLASGVAVTDDCAAVEQLGKQVWLAAGDECNIKITTPMDLAVAEAILHQREAAQ